MESIWTKKSVKANYMNKRLLGLMVFIVPFCISSCTLLKKSGKKRKNNTTVAVVDSVKTTDATLTDTTVTEISPENRKLINDLSPLWLRRMDYKTFSGKAKVSFESPDNSVDFSANFRITKDSLVWIHISAIGGLYSVARILVTPDSFFMVNYQQKEVTRLALTDAGRILPVPVRFGQLQNLFTGDPICNGDIVSAEEKDSVWSLSTEDSSFVQQLTYRKKDSLMQMGHLRSRKSSGSQAMIDYNNYEMSSNRMLSKKRTVHLQNGVNNYTIEMDIVNEEFDKVLEFPFTMPKNFTINNH